MVTEPATYRRFRPAFWPTLAVLPLFVLLVSLGLWQMDRAQQKTDIRDAVLTKGRLPELELGATKVTADQLYRRARGSGHYDPRLGFLLDNKVHQGQAGYHVMTPLQPGSGGQWILVNRGWVPWGTDRDRLPEIVTPKGEVVVHGRLVAPEKIPLALSKSDALDFDQRWQSVDLERFARVSGRSVAPLILQLDPKAGNGFIRQWPAYSDQWIDRHTGYAVQWFALAFVLVVLFLGFSFKRTSDDIDNESS